MTLLAPLYRKVMTWSRHKFAARYLVVVSFAESSFFPIPPDIMLAPMALSKPEKALYYALITTIASVLGGILGYLIGMGFYEWIQPLIEGQGRWVDKYQLTRQWFDEWGVWAILIAGFSPIPYKVFTITAGILQMQFIPFVLASFVGRGARYFLLAWLMKLGGAAMEQKLEKYIDYLGMIVIFMAIVAYFIYKP
ncbi:MAG: YqaA family protein [Pseudomonadota bacterium]